MQKPEVTKVIELFGKELDDPALSLWMKEKVEMQHDSRSFFIQFGLFGRKIPRLSIDHDATHELGLKGAWSLDQLGRLALIMNLPVDKNVAFISTLLPSSDMREQVIIYKSFFYLANAADFTMLAIDGLRTNMIDVFDAIALDNPYPEKFFGEDPWNQMVLKSIFMERPLYRIRGLDDRKNERLAHILHDFAHERWSAKRKVTPELWRLVSGYVNEDIFADLLKVIETDDPLAAEAARKAMRDSTFSAAREWVEDHDQGETLSTWEEIGRKIQIET